ncbi:hypothetical protein [Streptomyces longwoodensis]|nr:hypothetical protein [Streptomyces longwoodensis]MCX5000244.1 hypothetical protein [Streptomyces longwoodensis]
MDTDTDTGTEDGGWAAAVSRLLLAIALYTPTDATRLLLSPS